MLPVWHANLLVKEQSGKETGRAPDLISVVCSFYLSNKKDRGGRMTFLCGTFFLNKVLLVSRVCSVKIKDLHRGKQDINRPKSYLVHQQQISTYKLALKSRFSNLKHDDPPPTSLPLSGESLA